MELNGPYQQLSLQSDGVIVYDVVVSSLTLVALNACICGLSVYKLYAIMLYGVSILYNWVSYRGTVSTLYYLLTIPPPLLPRAYGLVLKLLLFQFAITIITSAIAIGTIFHIALNQIH
jgi:hypothetical protein